MQLVVFSKALQGKSPTELVAIAEEVAADGYDLAVHPGHAVHPDNVEQALPELMRLFAAHMDAGDARERLRA